MSRSVFDERKWPEGYVFPTCLLCNQSTADDEALFALLCRFNPVEYKPDAGEQTRKLMLAVAERLPEIYQSFFPTANNVKGWLRKTGKTLPPGQTTKDVPILSLEHPEINVRIKKCAAKLFLSLHYMHMGRILPSEGAVIFRWFSNANTPDEIPADLLAPFVTEMPKLTWQKKSLNDQFMYRYGAEKTEGLVSVFFVTFHASVGMIGVIFNNLANLTADIPPEQILRPLAYNV